ncbi:hypothetical protein ACFWNK_36505 [Streptomyces sp. NPDC058417]|uniref:hypothetical protein n=1 Tax=unclassified Streptomyces TaxID=2593676 RepID=UPI00365236E3
MAKNPVTDVSSEENTGEGSAGGVKGGEGNAHGAAVVPPAAPATVSDPGSSRPAPAAPPGQPTPQPAGTQAARRDGTVAGGPVVEAEPAPPPHRTVSVDAAAAGTGTAAPARNGVRTTGAADVSAPVVTTSSAASLTLPVSGTPVPTSTSASAEAPSKPVSAEAAPVTSPPHSAVAAQDRAVTRTVHLADRQLDVLAVRGDGDCFFTSLLAGLHHQGHASPLAALDVRQLRDRAAEAFAGSAEHLELNEQDALDALLGDLPVGDLQELLGTPAPPLTARERAEIDDRLVLEVRRDRLRSLTAVAADRGVRTDLPGTAVRALQTAHPPQASDAPGGRRRALTEAVQTGRLRELTRRVLAQDSARSERLWARLLDDRYARWARSGTPLRLADFRDCRLGDLVLDSIRDADLWATPFFDHAPQAVARALGLNVTIVCDDPTALPPAPLNALAGPPLYVHHNGTDHYSAVRTTTTTDEFRAETSPDAPPVRVPTESTTATDDSAPGRETRLPNLDAPSGSAVRSPLGMHGLTADGKGEPDGSSGVDAASPDGSAEGGSSAGGGSPERAGSGRPSSPDERDSAAGEPTEVDDLLAARGIVLAPGREVIVLWSRFTGKRDHDRVEFDTSYTGMRQLLHGIRARTGSRKPGPLVVIAGDDKVNPHRPDHYPALTAELRRTGLDVHDLTGPWTDSGDAASADAATRSLFAHLHRQSGGRVQHLGFPSEDLRFLARAGQRVRYLALPDGIGGPAPAEWQPNGTGQLASPGPTRIVLSRPPTVSGQIVVEAHARWTEQLKADKPPLDAEHQNRLAGVAEQFSRLAWVYGRDPHRGATKPVKPQYRKGFDPDDVTTILDALLGPDGSPADRSLVGRSDAGLRPLGATRPAKPGARPASRKDNRDAQITLGGRQFDRVQVPADGDCFFHALRTGLALRHPGSPTAALDVRGLRDLAADRFEATEEFRRLNDQDAVEVLVGDLGLDDLTHILGGPLPDLPGDRLAAADVQVTSAVRRAELRRRVPAPADRAILADLPDAAVGALLPDFRPETGPEWAREHARLVDDARRAILRERLAALLRADSPEAEAAWRELVGLRYPRWADQRPGLADVRGRSVGRHVVDAIRDVDRWGTPFFDEAPQAVAQVLGVNVVVVTTDGEAAFGNELKPDAATTVHVHYNGADHYSALRPVTDPAPATAEGEGDPEAARTPEISRASEEPGTPEAAAGAEEVIALLRDRAPHTEERILTRLRGLSPQAVTALRSPFAGSPPPPPVAGGTDAASSPAHAPQSVTDIETELRTHRPPRLDRSMPPPLARPAAVAFSDGTRLPGHLDDTYGHAVTALRGTDQVVREIGGRADVPDDVLAHLERALRLTPEYFTGDGYVSPSFVDSTGRPRVMRVRTRPHGRWERFADAHGEPVNIDGGRRSQTTVGQSRTVTQSKRLGGSVPIGPPAGPAAFGRVGGTLRYGRTYDYTLQDQTLSQAETKRTDGSHVHLDDVQYEVSFEAAPTARRGRRARVAAGEQYLTFGVRSGLSLRLPDGEMTPGTAEGVPREMALGSSSDYRLVRTEGYGPVEAARVWALKRSGALPGSPAHQEISAFFSSEGFHRMADRLAHGRVPSGPLLGADHGPLPLGAVVVERVVPGRAVLLTASEAAELTNTVQQTVRNERGQSKTYGWEVQATLGPSVDFPHSSSGPMSARLMLAAVARYARSATHGLSFGGSGARKTTSRGQKTPTALYKVEKTIHARFAGETEVRTFTTWSLDRMTHTEARRLAGWNDGTGLRSAHGNQPFAPAYLTNDDPAVLGMAHPESFPRQTGAGQEPTLLREFTDQVVAAAARRYPDLIAPLAELNGRTGRWRDPERYGLALQNTLAVINTLSHHSMVGNLEAVVTTGIRIALTGHGRFTRPRRYLWIDGRLTGRAYEGTRNDLTVSTGAPGTEQLEGSRSGSRTVEGGDNAGLVLRSTVKDAIGAPQYLGNLTVGPRWSRQRGDRTEFGSSASYAALAASNAPSHLYSYQLELTAKSGGYWRPRSLWRGLPTLGLLGTGLFVRAEAERDLIGGTAPTPSAKGKVLLAVPGEHTPRADPHTGPHVAPAPRTETLTGERARALAAGDTGRAGADHGSAFGDQPYQTVSVGGHRELAEAVEAVMGTASRGSWHFRVPGSPAHDATVRPFQPQYLTAAFDQTSGANGSWTGGLFGKGPYMNRIGALLHRTRVVRPVVVSDALRLDIDQSVGSDTQSSGAVTTTHAFTVTGGLGYGTTHPVRPSLGGSYGLTGHRGRGRAKSRTVTRTVTSEISRSDEGYQVLVSGDTQHDVLAATRTDGVLSPAYDLFTFFRSRWAGRRLTFAADWLGHLPEKAAHRLGLIRDTLGEVPRYVEKVWRKPDWLLAHPFGSYPVNTLDTSEVLGDFDRALRALNADDAGRERARSLVGARTVRALREQMVSSGAPSPVRVGRLNLGRLHLGGRSGTLRVELVQERSTFDGLDHSAMLSDTRVAAETVASSDVTSRDWGAGVAVSESIRTGAAGAPAAPAALATSGSTERQVATGRSSTRKKEYVFSPNEPHADFLTSYRMTLTLTLDNGEVVARSERPVGQVREQVPLSLLVPDDGTRADDPLAPPTLAPEPSEVTVWGPTAVTPQAVEAWRTAPPADGAARMPQLPSDGFFVRRLTEPDTVRAAAELAVARAYGAGAAAGNGKRLSGDDLVAARARARRTALTRPGSAGAQALEGGTGDAALSAFFGDALTGEGHQVAGVVDASLAGAHGEFRLYARPDLGGARLLTVAPDSTMESSASETDSADTSTERTEGQDAGLSGQAVVAAAAAGAAVPGVSLTLGNSGDAEATKQGRSQGGQVRAKPSSGRSFLFAIPVDWLGVAEVEHDVKDSAVGSFVGRALGPLGRVRRGPQAVETRSRVLAWVREDVARDLGLVTDATFPGEVADAWTTTTRAAEAWTAADQAYWALRRSVGQPRVRHLAARRRLVAAKARLAEAGAAAGGHDHPARRAVREAKSALRDARGDLPRRAWRSELADLRRAADDAAHAFHTARAATDRLTRWYQLSPERRLEVARPPAPVLPEQPSPHPSREEAARYTPGPDGVLTTPDGARRALLDVPKDGAAFYHALAAGLRHTDAGLPGRLSRAEGLELVAGLRDTLAARLGAGSDPDLLAVAVPDRTDRFTSAELDQARIDFATGTPQRAEFEDGRGRLPLYEEWTEDQRRALAVAQIRRGGADAPSGWDHGAADLLPALAAREFGVTVTVVREDGTFQDFAPTAEGTAGAPAATAGRANGRTQVVLYLEDRHYRAALPEPLPSRPLPPAPTARPTTPAEAAEPQAARPAHTTAPWAVAPGPGAWRRDPATGQGTLTAPDGTVHDLVEPTGEGNNFWGALSAVDERNSTRARGRSLPPGAVVDRTAPFTVDELRSAGVDRAAALAGFRGSGDVLPDGLRLTERQSRQLVLAQVRAARHWNAATEETAARMAADAFGAPVTIVSEEGVTRSFLPPADPSGRPGKPDRGRVTLYQRGSEYLLLRPRATAGSAPLPVRRPSAAPSAPRRTSEPDFLAREVSRDDVVGLTLSQEVTAHWDLAPGPRRVSDLELTPEDLMTLAKRLTDRSARQALPEGPGGTAQRPREGEKPASDRDDGTHATTHHHDERPPRPPRTVATGHVDVRRPRR